MGYKNLCVYYLNSENKFTYLVKINWSLSVALRLANFKFFRLVGFLSHYGFSIILGQIDFRQIFLFGLRLGKLWYRTGVRRPCPVAYG